MNYYPHHIGDFNNATRHLSRLERSIYRDLIELYYDTESPLTLDLRVLCRRIIARTEEESTAVQQVLNEFFTETEQGWYHERCEREIEKYHGYVSAKSAAGKASAAKRAQKTIKSTRSSSADVQQVFNDCSTTVQLTNNQEPLTNNQEPLKEKTNKKDKSFFVLPDWINAEAWNAFEEMRKKIKKPLTDRAREMAITELHKLTLQGNDPSEVLNNSTLKCYPGLYDVKKQSPPDNVSWRRRKTDYPQSKKFDAFNSINGVDENGNRKEEFNVIDISGDVVGEEPGVQKLISNRPPF